MDMNFPPDTDAFRTEVRSFFANNYPKDLIAKAASGDPLDKADYQKSERALSEKGWLCVNWPEDAGGPGWDVTKKFIYDEELELAGAISPVPMGVIYVGPVIVAFGDDEQKMRWLPGIQQSTTFWAQGYSEPGSGSDLASLQCQAKRDGDDYIVNGTKIWTSLAQHADWIFALVRTSHEDVKQQGITFLCAPMNSPGIEVHPIITIDGRHSLNRVTFDNVRVPVQNRIGEEGQGWHYANFLLGNERTSYAHVAGKRMQMAAIEPFMESIGEQDHQTQFNDLSVRLDTLDVTVLRVLATVANGESPGNESSILKIMATELAQDITELGMVVRQYAGIASFSAEMPDRAGAKAMVDYLGTRSQSIYGGSNEIQKNIIAKRVLGL